MKIKELIRILRSAPDQEREVYTESSNNYWTTNIVTSFDDNNDMRLYEVAENFINTEFSS